MKKGSPGKQKTARQKTIRVFFSLIQIALLAAALWDIHRRSEDEINGSKRTWRAIVFVNYIGPIAYFLFGRKQEQSLPLASLP